MRSLPAFRTIRRATLAALTALTALALLPPLGGGLLAQDKARVVRVRPPAPANVRAVRTSPTEVTLTWDAVPGATGYAIGRHVPPAGWASVARVSANTTRYVDSRRVFSASHQYGVNTIAGDMASLGTQSNLLLPDAPVTALEPEDGPGPKGEAEAPVDKGAATAGCRPFGGHYVCTGERVTFAPGTGHTKSAIAYCPTTSHVPVGGGWSGDLRGEGEVQQSIPTIDLAKGRPGWEVQVRRTNLTLGDRVGEQVGATLGTNARSLYFQIYVVCAPAR